MEALTQLKPLPLVTLAHVKLTHKAIQFSGPERQMTPVLFIASNHWCFMFNLHYLWNLGNQKWATGGGCIKGEHTLLLRIPLIFVLGKIINLKLTKKLCACWLDNARRYYTSCCGRKGINDVILIWSLHATLQTGKQDVPSCIIGLLWDNEQILIEHEACSSKGISFLVLQTWLNATDQRDPTPWWGMEVWGSCYNIYCQSGFSMFMFIALVLCCSTLW